MRHPAVVSESQTDPNLCPGNLRGFSFSADAILFRLQNDPRALAHLQVCIWIHEQRLLESRFADQTANRRSERSRGESLKVLTKPRYGKAERMWKGPGGFCTGAL